MKLIVGLGNPGREYEATRHNVGFRVVEDFARRHRATPWEHRLPVASYRDCQLAGGIRVRLLRPLTMMNCSGEAVRLAQRSWRVTPENILMVYDDVNLPLGTLRVRGEGGAGGHHGMLSCLKAVGTEAVARLRVGVGAASLPRDLTEFVLSPFAAKDMPVVKQALDQAVEACEVWATEGLAVAMNRVNTRQDKP